MRNVICTVVAVSALLAAAVVVVGQSPTSGSPLAPPSNGPRSVAPTHHVLVNATVHPAPGVTWKRGVVEFEGGRIVRAMERPAAYEAPAGATVHDAEGLHVYAGFIDLYAEAEAPAAREHDASGAHWNQWVTPDRRVSDGEGLAASRRAALRESGFTAALLVPRDGVFAGRTALVSLTEPAEAASSKRERLYADKLHHALRFTTSGWGVRRYPTSHPGCVALMRQTLMDADWQREHSDGPVNALTPLEDASVPLLVKCTHELETLLADDVAREAGRSLVLIGSGAEYKWLDAVAEAGWPVVSPLRFPRKPDVSSPGAAGSIELEELMAWEQAPTNVRRLADAGVLVALTSSDMGRRGSFLDRVREAVDAGLSERDALAMLTTNPATILAMHDDAGRSDDDGRRLGQVRPGYRANLVVTDRPIFEDDARVLDVYIDGVRHTVGSRDDANLNGVWRMMVGPRDKPAFRMLFRVTGAGESGRVQVDLREAGAIREARNANVEGGRIRFLIDDVDGGAGTYIVSGVLQPSGEIRGAALGPGERNLEWIGERTASDAFAATDHDEPIDDDADERVADAVAPNADGQPGDATAAVPDLPGYPFGPYAVAPTDVADAGGLTVITNATVWTQGPLGVIDDGFVAFADGEVIAVGAMPVSGVDVSNARLIDASAAHVTPGLIDAHSHTGLFRFGVNEAGQAVTSEVRIADSLDPSYISWYRQLAAGVTTVLSLHGSANPIGGQSQTHKVRWGVDDPRDMRMVGSTPGIKFALGENVKQSNWSLRPSERTRYPQTRMGVEGVMRDRFSAALSYMREQERARRDGVAPPRRDLELEPLAEVLRGERLVHCHSYRQDEILMLCRIAEDFGFTIGTFQHGLEVYKVAEAVRKHAIGASLFSDWWMYKVEVMDAIPFAGPLQTEAGVLTSYNSDSDELARRLNLEAAKVLKYARRDANGQAVLSEQEALAFVTNNAAVQMGVGDRIGSLDVGKDADVVVWSDHPLSTRAVVQRTFVDGVERWSLERDAEMRQRIAAERDRLIAKVVAAPDRPRDAEDDEHGDHGHGADDAMPPERAALAAWYRQELAAGRDPEAAQGGDCGCGLIDHKRHLAEHGGAHRHEH
jgi:imidazolonepropionase-like amidohydrolase